MSGLAVDYRTGLLEDLSDAAQAAVYLNAALEDGDQEVFLLALRHVAEARGMSQVAREARLNRENMYRMLSAAGNQKMSSLNALLRSIGLRRTVEVAPPAGTSSGAAMLAESQASYGTAESERRPLAQVQSPPVSQTIIEERR
jgi:probable addiction module antidote protein